ncbi:MAG: AmmeMemoRadiSam system radical SAM enzyme [Candidatus Aenigmatarchaeota archaeon]
MFEKNGSMYKADFWKKEKGGIRCELCARNCFIPKNSEGFCKVRKNFNNKLFSLNYGKVVAINLDPIEKKPLFHFYPGSFALSYSCFGCNWACKYCCNWEISQTQLLNWFEKYEPEQIVEIAENQGVKIISHTYTEPTVFFEFAYEVAKLAHKKNIKNTFVTNGFMSEKPLKKISKYLDAATVDFKASGDEDFLKKYASVPSSKPVFNTLKLMKELKIHVEITNLVIPKIGEDKEKFKELVTWVLNNLGKHTPLHIIRFFPSYKMMNVEATKISTLEDFAKEAKKIGLDYVYIGNVPGHELENTYCPYCGGILIERFGFKVNSYIKENQCPKCGFKLEGFILEN